MRLRAFGRSLLRKAGQTVFDVGCIADLAALTVADNVDAKVDLAPHDIGNGPADGRVEFRQFRDSTIFPAFESGHNRLASRQAADVGGQDFILACFQQAPLRRCS